MQTHEQFIQSIVSLALPRLNDLERKEVKDAKIVYGAGQSSLRGVTYYKRWENGGGPDHGHSFVEICAFGESDPVQIAGTTLHELSHVAAGYDAGHGKVWKETCERLGLRLAKAAGHNYTMAGFDPDMRHAIAALESPVDGKPIGLGHGGLILKPRNPRPCGSVIGVKGGASRGKGSGSRLLKVECDACGYVARVSGKWLATGAPLCPCNQQPMAIV